MSDSEATGCSESTDVLALLLSLRRLGLRPASLTSPVALPAIARRLACRPASSNSSSRCNSALNDSCGVGSAGRTPAAEHGERNSRPGGGATATEDVQGRAKLPISCISVASCEPAEARKPAPAIGCEARAGCQGEPASVNGEVPKQGDTLGPCCTKVWPNGSTGCATPAPQAGRVLGGGATDRTTNWPEPRLSMRQTSRKRGSCSNSTSRA
mmetsp:Transcript_65236/g.187625  ORF Transcript_65236/g.187625 Transcript_65236/m.187625 type:complete len:212 (+) Transcript_65236:238-873(+)